MMSRFQHRVTTATAMVLGAGLVTVGALRAAIRYANYQVSQGRRI